MCAERRKVEMTQEKINILYGVCQWLERLGADDPEILQKFKTNSHFAYAVSFNQDEIEGYVRKFEKYVRNDKEYDECEAERMKLIEEKHGKRNDKGELVTVNGVYTMKDPMAFNADLKKLHERYPAYQIRQDKLEEVFEVEFHVVPFRHVPKWLPIGVMRPMRPFITYEPEEWYCPACGEKLLMEDGELVMAEEPKHGDVPDETPAPMPPPRPAPMPPLGKARARRK